MEKKKLRIVARRKNPALVELHDEELNGVIGGAMIVNHNEASIGTLTQQKYQKALSKSLQKLSTGMKINSSSDDSSGYQISERMRVRLRALSQDD